MSKKMNSEQTEVLKKVLRYMRRYWFYLAISILLAAITVASTLYIPLLTILFPQILSTSVAQQLQPVLEPAPYLSLLLFPLAATLLLLCLSVISRICWHWKMGR